MEKRNVILDTGCGKSVFRAPKSIDFGNVKNTQTILNVPYPYLEKEGSLFLAGAEIPQRLKFDLISENITQSDGTIFEGILGMDVLSFCLLQLIRNHVVVAVLMQKSTLLTE